MENVSGGIVASLEERFGVSSSGKTQDFGSCIRRFESSHPSHVSERCYRWVMVDECCFTFRGVPVSSVLTMQ